MPKRCPERSEKDLSPVPGTAFPGRTKNSTVLRTRVSETPRYLKRAAGWARSNTTEDRKLCAKKLDQSQPSVQGWGGLGVQIAPISQIGGRRLEDRVGPVSSNRTNQKESYP